MRKIALLIFLILFSTDLAGCGPPESGLTAKDPEISGELHNGFRILPIPASGQNIRLSVYRGDYIKFSIDESFKNPVLSVPTLSIDQELAGTLEEAPYFKMNTAGTFAFTLGAVAGTLDVHDYRQPNYREVTAREASAFIDSDQPLVLDVRTPKEYEAGHMKAAVLIPVQVLESRLKELTAYKDKPILIYCATGNRSTVASKILIDNGFKQITNMRHGIVDWQAKQYPVVQ